MDHSKVSIKEKCKILIRLKNSSHQFIGDIYYITTVKSDILSMGQWLEKGYEIKMKDRTLILLDTHESMVAKVTMKKNKKFLLNIEMDMPKCVKTRVKNETWLWHMRLRHANFDNLEMITQKKMLKGLPSIIHPNYLCEGCFMGKQFRNNFPKDSTSRGSQPL